LAEERALFPVEQVGEIQSTYGHIDFQFHLLYLPCFWFLFVLIPEFRASLRNREVT
jgi:hypothetical protein